LPLDKPKGEEQGQNEDREHGCATHEVTPQVMWQRRRQQGVNQDRSRVIGVLLDVANGPSDKNSAQKHPHEYSGCAEIHVHLPHQTWRYGGTLV